MGEDGKGGRDEYKKSKPILTPPYGADLKSQPTLAPPPLRGGENSHGAKRGGVGQAVQGKIAIPRYKEKGNLYKCSREEA